MRTVDCILHPSFKGNAIARNLLGDDSVWERVMEEAVASEMPVQLRQLFVNICVHCSPTNAQLIFESNLHHLMEDYTRRGHNKNVAKNVALKSLQDILRLSGHCLEEFQLPIPDLEIIDRMIEMVANQALETVRDQRRRRGELMIAKLNFEQQQIFDQIMTSVDNHPSANNNFFYRLGGTGKTFLYNTLINVPEGQGKSVRHSFNFVK